MYGNQQSKRTLKTSRISHGDLTRLMAEAIAWYPNQRIEKLTQTLHLQDWKLIAEKHSLERFETALKTVLHRVDFYPLPRVIEDECEALRRQTWQYKPTMHVWECEACHTTQASERAENCCYCKGSSLNMKRLTSEPDTNVEMKRYYERIKTHPEDFVRVGDIFKEVMAKKGLR